MDPIDARRKFLRYLAGSPLLGNGASLGAISANDDRSCIACHGGGFANEVSRKPNFQGIDVSKVSNLYGTGMTWDFVKKLRNATKMKLLLKGIMTGEDAARAVQAGVDGIIVSNHGGRSEESLQSTIGALPEVVKAVGGRIPVLVDGGVRRGTDFYKALALGATAIRRHRPIHLLKGSSGVWGTASMPPNPVTEADALVLVKWVLDQK